MASSSHAVAVLRILFEAGLLTETAHKKPQHHRRERKSQAGMLVQIDASPHDWLQGRGPCLHLLAAIDDATGQLLAAVFRQQEDAVGYFDCSGNWSSVMAALWPSITIGTACFSRPPSIGARGQRHEQGESAAVTTVASPNNSRKPAADHCWRKPLLVNCRKKSLNT